MIMMRQSIAIDMDEVLADTLKKVIFQFNESAGMSLTKKICTKGNFAQNTQNTWIN